jgi:hypothetical protein
MRNYPRAVTWSLLAFSVALYFVRSTCMRAEQDGQVRVSFMMRAAKVTLHEPVYIEFSIHNGLPEAVRLDLEYGTVLVH